MLRRATLLALLVMIAGCDSGSTTRTLPNPDPSQRPIAVTDEPVGQEWYRDLTASLTASVDQLKGLDGAKLDARVASNVTSLTAFLDSYSRDLRAGYTFAYNASITDYSQSGPTEAERTAIRNARTQIAAQAAEDMKRSRAVAALVEAFRANPTDTSFIALRDAVVALVGQTGAPERIPGTQTSAIPQAVPGTKISTSVTSTGDASQVIVAAGNTAPTTIMQVHTLEIDLRPLAATDSPQELAALRHVIAAGLIPFRDGMLPLPALVSDLTQSQIRFFLPLNPSADTRISSNFDFSPFAIGDRQVQLQVVGVDEKSRMAFRCHVKTDMWLAEDGSAQINKLLNPGDGSVFWIARVNVRPQGLYLAWRSDGGMTREEFVLRNPDAVVILTVLV